MSNAKQEAKDRAFLKVANNLATLSHCAKIQVGAVVVKDGRILTSGVNGTPTGHLNCDEIHTEGFDHAAHRVWADKHELHAEMNMIAFAARYGIALDGATVYSNLQPCDQCTKNMTAAGIVRIVYEQAYDRMSEADRSEAELFLMLSNIQYQHLPSLTIEK